MTRPTPPPEPQRTVEARRVGAKAGADSGASEFTYSVLPDPLPAQSNGGDRRRSQRQRTRLRSGKLAGIDGTFLTECLVYDLSAKGCRLRLSAGLTLPRTVQLFDDQSGQLYRCSILWRDGNDVGLRFEAPPHPDRAREQADALRRKFYAVRN